MKKGVPVCENVNKNATKIKTGNTMINPDRETKKSKNLLKNDLYIS